MTEKYLRIGVTTTGGGTFTGYNTSGNLTDEEYRFLHMGGECTEGFYFGHFSGGCCCRYVRRISDNGRSYCTVVGISMDKMTGQKYLTEPKKLLALYRWLDGMNEEELTMTSSLETGMQTRRRSRGKSGAGVPPLTVGQTFAVRALAMQEALSHNSWYLLEHGSVETMGEILSALPRNLRRQASFACPYAPDVPMALFLLMPEETELDRVRVQNVASQCRFENAAERLSPDAVDAARFLQAINEEELRKFGDHITLPERFAAAAAQSTRLHEAIGLQDAEGCQACKDQLGRAYSSLPDWLTEPAEKLLAKSASEAENRSGRHRDRPGKRLTEDSKLFSAKWLAAVITIVVTALFLIAQGVTPLRQVVAQAPSLLDVNAANGGALLLLGIAIGALIFMED